MSRHTASMKAMWSRALSWFCCNGFMQCAVCGTNEELTKDHIVPRSFGGGNEQNNICILCATCNVRKGNQFWDLKPFAWPDEGVVKIKAASLRSQDWLFTGQINNISRHNNKNQSKTYVHCSLIGKGIVSTKFNDCAFPEDLDVLTLSPLAVGLLLNRTMPQFSY